MTKLLERIRISCILVLGDVDDARRHEARRATIRVADWRRIADKQIVLVFVAVDVDDNRSLSWNVVAIVKG